MYADKPILSLSLLCTLNTDHEDVLIHRASEVKASAGDGNLQTSDEQQPKEGRQALVEVAKVNKIECKCLYSFFLCIHIQDTSKDKIPPQMRTLLYMVIRLVVHVGKCWVHNVTTHDTGQCFII